MIFEIPDLLLGFICGITVTIGALIGIHKLSNVGQWEVKQTIGGL